jgi:TonB family protein
MSKLVVLTLVIAPACAAGGFPLARETSSTAKVQFTTTAPDGVRAAFPRAIEPALPHVDRLAHQVRARFGDDAVASINLCVSPAGRVTKVALIEGSTFDAFDRALVQDVGRWQFAAMPGPAKLEVCDRATIAYRAPR